jgi:TatD DNase family protein
MGKNNKKKSNIIPAETYLRLPPLADASLADQPIIDTHTHLVSTFSTYRSKYKNGTLYTIYDFVREMYRDRNVKAIVDVWCEAPVLMTWRELADSALTAEDREQKWGGVDYWFVMGELFNRALSLILALRDDSDRRSPVCIGSDVSHGSELIILPGTMRNHTTMQLRLPCMFLHFLIVPVTLFESFSLEAMAHPRCVGWGEMGLDYHYNNSPRAIQQEVFIRQLNHAVRLGKPLTIHTREAEADTERILMEHVPADHKVLPAIALVTDSRG